MYTICIMWPRVTHNMHLRPHPPTPPSIRGTGTGAWTYRSWVWIEFSHCWKCLINPFWRALNSLTVSAKESLFRSGECCLPIAFSMQNTKIFLGPIGPRIPTHIMHFVDAQYASGTPPPPTPPPYGGPPFLVVTSDVLFSCPMHWMPYSVT